MEVDPRGGCSPFLLAILLGLALVLASPVIPLEEDNAVPAAVVETVLPTPSAAP